MPSIQKSIPKTLLTNRDTTAGSKVAVRVVYICHSIARGNDGVADIQSAKIRAKSVLHEISFRKELSAEKFNLNKIQV